MTSSHEQIKKDHDHNSAGMKTWIKDQYEAYAECDEISAKMNKKRAEIREGFKKKGLDPKAFVDQYTVAKKKTLKTEKEGYAETSNLCWDALNMIKMDDLFAFAKKPEKPAPEPKKPKDQKSVGEQQAAAITAASGKPN